MMSAAQASSHTPAGGQYKIQVQTVDMKLGIMGHRLKDSPLQGTYQSHFNTQVQFRVSNQPYACTFSVGGNPSTERKLRKATAAQSQLWPPESKQSFVHVRCPKDQILEEN